MFEMILFHMRWARTEEYREPGTPYVLGNMSRLDSVELDHIWFQWRTDQNGHRG